MFKTPESRWRALQARDPLAVSAFVYAVTTTRIFCRPACPSRLARRANIVFFDSATDAQSAGFRACKRCKPSSSFSSHRFSSQIHPLDPSKVGSIGVGPQQQQKEATVRKACELVKAAGGKITLEQLADGIGLSPRYFHGVFKAVMGVTPSGYATIVRSQAAAAESGKGTLSEEWEGIGGLPPVSKDDGDRSTVHELDLVSQGPSLLTGASPCSIGALLGTPDNEDWTHTIPDATSLGSCGGWSGETLGIDDEWALFSFLSYPGFGDSMGTVSSSGVNPQGDIPSVCAAVWRRKSCGLRFL